MVKNFVTYDYCTVFPGPSLNLIVGPNGTGKSTIVCAIGIGLGASISILGRMRDISNYVKHGKDSAFVEITLKTPTSPNYVTIKRQFSSQSSGSEWFVNGEKRAFKFIQQTTLDLSINLENLCQFLAQERVGEFARLDGSELLRETLRAVDSSGDILRSLEAATEQQSKTTREAQEVRSAQEQLENLKRQNAALEAQIERIRGREQHKKSISLLKAKRKWLLYDTARNEYLLVKKDRESIRQLLEAAKSEAKPQRLEIQRLQASRPSLRPIPSSSSVDSFSETASQILSQQTLIRKRSQDERRMLGEIDALRSDLEKLDADISALPNTSAQADSEGGQQIARINESLARIQADNDALIRKQRQIESDSELHRLEIERLTRELTRLSDSQHQRLLILRSLDQDAFTTSDWVTKNANRFSGTVHLPLCLSIDLNNAGEFASEFEDCCSHQVMTMIVCEQESDYELLQNELITRQKLRVNLHYQRSSIASFVPRVPLSEIHSIGFSGYLIDFVKAPDIVRAALCQLSQMHLVPVSKGTVSEDSIRTRFRDIQRFYSNSLAYNITRSSGGEEIVRTQRLRAPRLLGTVLSDSIGRDAIAAQLASLCQQRDSNKATMVALLEEQRPFRESEQRLLAEKEAILSKRREAAAAQQRYLTLVDRRKVHVTTLNRAVRQVDSARSESKQLAKDLKKAVSLVDWKSQLKMLCQSSERGDLAAAINEVLIDAKIARKVQILSEHASGLENRIRDLEGQEENVEAIVASAKAKAKELLYEAEASNSFTDSQKRQMAEAPGSLPELEAELVRLEALLEMTSDADAHLLQEYETRERRIASLSEVLNSTSAEQEAAVAQFQQLRSLVATRISDIIGKVSGSFSSIFRKIRPDGDGSLTFCYTSPTDGSPDPIEQWNLQIHVKFRPSAALSRLSHQRQSGGERSVATFVYLMALQYFTTSPFRVVDEINQGMDAKNESKMHDLLVELVADSTEARLSQYFLVTPKLLRNLRYGERSTILTVFNGENVPSTSENLAPIQLSQFL